MAWVSQHSMQNQRTDCVGKRCLDSFRWLTSEALLADKTVAAPAPSAESRCTALPAQQGRNPLDPASIHENSMQHLSLNLSLLSFIHTFIHHRHVFLQRRVCAVLTTSLNFLQATAQL